MSNFDIESIESALSEIYKPGPETDIETSEPERDINFYFSAQMNPYAPQQLNELFATAAQNSAVGRASATKKLDSDLLHQELVNYELKENEDRLRFLWKAITHPNDPDTQGTDTRSRKKVSKARYGKTQSINVKVGLLSMFADGTKAIIHNDPSPQLSRRTTSATLLGAKAPTKEELEQEPAPQTPPKFKRNVNQTIATPITLTGDVEEINDDHNKGRRFSQQEDLGSPVAQNNEPFAQKQRSSTQDEKTGQHVQMAKPPAQKPLPPKKILPPSKKPSPPQKSPFANIKKQSDQESANQPTNLQKETPNVEGKSKLRSPFLDVPQHKVFGSPAPPNLFGGMKNQAVPFGAPMQFSGAKPYHVRKSRASLSNTPEVSIPPSEEVRRTPMKASGRRPPTRR